MLRRQNKLSRTVEKAKGEALRGDRTRLDTFHKIEVTLAPWCRDKMTRTSAGLGRVIQEQSSFRTQLCVLHTFQESTSPLDNTTEKRVFLLRVYLQAERNNSIIGNPWPTAPFKKRSM